MKNKMMMPKGSKALSVEEMRSVDGGKRIAFINNDICKTAVFAVFGTTEGITKGMIIDKIDVFANFLVEQIPAIEQIITQIITIYSSDFAQSLVEVCGTEDMGLAIDLGFPTLVDFSATLPVVE